MHTLDIDRHIHVCALKTLGGVGGQKSSGKSGRTQQLTRRVMPISLLVGKVQTSNEHGAIACPNQVNTYTDTP